MVQVVEKSEDYETMIAATPLVVVDFYADWCGPCRMIAPEIEKMEAALSADVNTKGKVSFVKVNVDKHNELAAGLGISAMPTFLFYVKGEKKGTVVGAAVQKLKDKVAELYKFADQPDAEAEVEAVEEKKEEE